MNLLSTFRIFIILVLFSWAGISSTAQDIFISQQPSKGAFPVVADGRATPIIIDFDDAEVVRTIAETFADDIQMVTGIRPTVSDQIEKNSMPIIIGTLGQSHLIDALDNERKIKADDIRDQWESYAIEIVDDPVKGVKKAIVCYGQNPRATAYAMLELSKLSGVSPLVWWADVEPIHKENLYANGKRTLVKSPNVKYRGIFLNDEDWGLQPWAANGIDKDSGNIGPETYAKVMELLLRLRANTLWPAMHKCSQAFWDNNDNLSVAKRYDIVLGSSHCEPMLRNNEWEWRRYEYYDLTGEYADAKNDTWNYNSPNRDDIQQYWRQRVEESKDYDAIYTLGMRGVHDSAIAGYPTVSDKVAGLTDIITFQRDLIGECIGEPSTVPQIFVPYKEVLDAYNAGLEIPGDVTLTWTDDNHGYMRQLPRVEEQRREGGNGLYYHISYWGKPYDYLWLCSHSPALISYELSKAYGQGVKNLWIINVGDIKPAEAETQFAMELAWDTDKWNPENAYTFTEKWAAETFGTEVAPQIAQIKNEYYRLAQRGKPEHVFAIDYTVDEMDRRLADYERIAKMVDDVERSIHPRHSDAFFQLIEYPVKAAWQMNRKVFLAKKSLLEAKAGKRDLALRHADESRSAYNEIKRLTDRYNTGISSGKWNRMMSMNPRGLSQFEMPDVADKSMIASTESEISDRQQSIYKGVNYIYASPGLKRIDGLGVAGSSLTQWPVSTSSFEERDLAEAPRATYRVKVKKGNNKISARFLPTFPLNGDYDLRTAVSVEGQKPKVISLKTIASKGKWNENVVRGYNDATIDYVAPVSGMIEVTYYFLDPALALSEIVVSAD